MFGWLKRLIKRNNESINQSDESINQQSINQSEPSEDIRLQKDALELGLAAGYAGRSLKSLESSFERLESSIITKQWAEAYLLPLLKAIDENEQKRFETLLSALNYLKGASNRLPKEMQNEFQAPIQMIEKAVLVSPRLSPQKKLLFSILKEVNEISYSDLAQRLGISEDGLRGFLSVVNKQTNMLERFEKEGRKKWVRLKRAQSTYLDQSISNQSQDNQSNGQPETLR